MASEPHQSALFSQWQRKAEPAGMAVWLTEPAVCHTPEYKTLKGHNQCLFVDGKTSECREGKTEDLNGITGLALMVRILDFA